MALGHDVGDAHHFEDGAHRAAGDDAGTLGSGSHHDACGTMVPHHFVMNGAVLEGHLHHVVAGFFHGLLHGSGHFLGLALAHADTTVAVAHHGERCEAEDTTTLDDLGDAVDRDHLLAKAVVACVVLRFSLYFCHF